jgi:hypothetical protein
MGAVGETHASAAWARCVERSPPAAPKLRPPRAAAAPRQPCLASAARQAACQDRRRGRADARDRVCGRDGEDGGEESARVCARDRLCSLPGRHIDMHHILWCIIQNKRCNNFPGNTAQTYDRLCSSSGRHYVDSRVVDSLIIFIYIIIYIK